MWVDKMQNKANAQSAWASADVQADREEPVQDLSVLCFISLIISRNSIIIGGTALPSHTKSQEAGTVYAYFNFKVA